MRSIYNYIIRILIVFAVSLTLYNCDVHDNQPTVSSLKEGYAKVWYKQADLALGSKIVMKDAIHGVAISRGKGDENQAVQGRAYIFSDGNWSVFDEYEYSDFPLITYYDNETIWYLIHENYKGSYKPHLYSRKGAVVSEIKLPPIMWDEKDFVMWTGLSVLSSGNAYMVGQKGHIIYYDGKSWREVTSPAYNQAATNVYSGDLHDIKMINDSLGWAVGKNGLILKFEMNKWKLFNSPTENELNGIDFKNQNTGWIVGDKGTILKYDNGKWNQVPVDFRVPLYSIKILGENKIWIVGSRSTLLEYSDGNWIQNQYIKSFDDNFQDIDVIEDSNSQYKFWIVGHEGIYTNSQNFQFSFTDVTAQSSLRNKGKAALFFDCNADNYPEVLVLSEKGPNQFYENRHLNTFNEIIRDSGNREFNQFAAAADVNNDGYIDVLEAADDVHYNLDFGGNNFRFQSNEAENYLPFNSIQVDPGVSTAKFVDFNNDGNIDLYISNYNSDDMLFSNDGTGRFTNVYEQSGINKLRDHRSFGATFSDFNNDNLVDIVITYRAAESGKHISLFINKGDFKFTEKDDSTFYSDVSPATFSVIANDFNNDGFTDLIVFNNNERLKVLINNGDSGFTDKAVECGFAQPLLHPEPLNGTLNAADVNNDGWLDLFIGSKLYVNSPGLHFREITEQVGLNFTGTPSFADIDNDGDNDLFIGSTEGSLGPGARAALFRNNLVNPGFIKVITDCDISNRSGIGTKIILTCSDNNGIELYKTLRQVGLGSCPMVEQDFTQTLFGADPKFQYSIKVIFPSGVEEFFPNVQLNSIIKISESSFLKKQVVLFSKTFQRTLLLLSPAAEIVKLMLFVGFFSIVLFYGRKTRVSGILGKWYFLLIALMIYLIMIYLTVSYSMAVSFIISSGVTLSCLMISLWVISKRIEKKESKFISHYKLIEIIGVGGMGKVFKALDTQTKTEVALKIINPTVLKDEENQKRLASEGELLTRFNHPNIIKVFEVSKSEKHTFIAMEYLKGGTLEDYINKNFPVELDSLKRIILQILDGIEVIHNNNVIHRDLKSINIMFDGAGNIRIMDFGLSKSPLVTTMTSLGTVVGTLGFVAPEQVTNIMVDHRTDIFSLGVLLYQLFTNKLPFTGENEIALIHSIFNTVPELPSEINPLIPAFYDKIVMKCLEKNPENRYNSVSGIRNDFLKF